MGEDKMIRLASIIETFEAAFLAKHSALPSHQRALTAMKYCRTAMSPKMQAQCVKCDEYTYVPHSCGHRSCPHCQAHESQQWLERQLQKQVPGSYFLLTFTLPAQLRSLAFAHQRIFYDAMMKCSWETVRTFSLNDTSLKGIPGAISVLHTHSRCLDFHPHIHMVMPAAAIDLKQRLWRMKRSKGTSKYLFNHKALAKVFRAKLLEAINRAGLVLQSTPYKWVVDCKHVGSGEKALIYLGRYLYRGVIQEKDILACEEGQVTYRYRNSKTDKMERLTVSGVEFLRRVLQHVLPKGFRRARNFGFLHTNSKQMIQVLQMLHACAPTFTATTLRKRPVLRCRCCGSEMRIVRTRIPATRVSEQYPPDKIGGDALIM
jgi:hypothetical protein